MVKLLQVFYENFGPEEIPFVNFNALKFEEIGPCLIVGNS